MPMNKRSGLEVAYHHCLKMAKSHYENFPVASLAIPKRLRPHVAAIYAFARTADDFADEAQFEGVRMERLNEWEEKLHQCVNGADDPVFMALADTIQRFQLPIQLFQDLITAFKMDVVQNRYATFEELRFYCQHSANPVGRLILHLFGYVHEEWFHWSDFICTALQLVNFWQDVSVDLNKDRIYIPNEDMVRHGISEGSLFAHELSGRMRHLMEFQIHRTQTLFDEGRELTRQVPNMRLRLELKLTWHGGVAILKKIEKNKYEPFTRPIIGWADKVKIIGKSLT